MFSNNKSERPLGLIVEYLPQSVAILTLRTQTFSNFRNLSNPTITNDLFENPKTEKSVKRRISIASCHKIF